MMKNSVWLILLSISLVFVSGCGSHGGRYFKILAPYKGEYTAKTDGKVVTHISGRACARIFWVGPFILPLSSDGDLRSATEAALENFRKVTDKEASYLINAYEKRTYTLIPLPIGYFESCSEVDGEAVLPKQKRAP